MMKKTASLILTALLLCTLCLPMAAASKDVVKVLYNAEMQMNMYVQNFDNRCLKLPITLKPIIFADITVEIDGKDAYFDSAADLEETEDGILIIPKEEEYVEPIIFAVMRDFPFLQIEEGSAETSGIIVSLPEMTKDKRDFCKKQLDAFWENCSKLINSRKVKIVPKLMEVGGSDADKAELDAICDDALERMNAVKDKYEGYIRTRRDLYLKEHPEDADEGDTETGSVLSEGSLAVIVGAACFAVGFLSAMFIFKKKKKSAPVENGENKGKE